MDNKKPFTRGKYKVIEVFSRASEKILGLSKEPRKNKDEYDALLCALTAKAYLEGNYEDLDGIIIPKWRNKSIKLLFLRYANFSWKNRFRENISCRFN